MRKHPPDGPRLSNCYFWAKWREWRKGGYIMSRRSRHSRWKRHYMWTRNGKICWGYVPRSPHVGIVAVIHGFRFRGHIEREH